MHSKAAASWSNKKLLGLHVSGRLLKDISGLLGEQSSGSSQADAWSCAGSFDALSQPHWLVKGLQALLAIWCVGNVAVKRKLFQRTELLGILESHQPLKWFKWGENEDSCGEARYCVYGVYVLSFFVLLGLFGEALDLRRDRHLPIQLEAHRAWSHPLGFKSLGRPGGLERRLLPDSQGHHCGRHVSHWKHNQLMWRTWTPWRVVNPGGRSNNDSVTQLTSNHPVAPLNFGFQISISQFVELDVSQSKL